MSQKNELLKTLIEEWTIYTEADRPSSLSEFATWLYEKQPHLERQRLSEEIEQKIQGDSLDNTVAEYFGKLSQFASVWTKLTFKETLFQGFNDYGIVQYVFYAKAPTKSMAIAVTKLERSTAFEILRRLQKLGLIEEFPDENDRRTKRVKITTKGKAELKKADRRVDQISKLLMGNLSEHKKVDLLKLLLSLTEFHTKEYEKGIEEVEQNWFPK